MTKPAKKQSLGRGISAIFGNSPEATISSINDKNADKIVGNIIELELDLIETNPFQPRTSFNEEELQGLASYRGIRGSTAYHRSQIRRREQISTYFG